MVRLLDANFLIYCLYISLQQSPEIPVATASNSYTTSSGRIVKNPNNFPITGANLIQSQKRVRIGAVTRSLISPPCNSAPNNVVSAAGMPTRANAISVDIPEKVENVSSVEVNSPMMVPIGVQKSESFQQVWVLRSIYKTGNVHQF